jgi:RimJ/RimL family protein N-acetyltransferase
MDAGVELTDGVVSLRPWTMDDAEFLHAACRDADIRRFWLREPLETVDDARVVIDAIAAAWDEYRSSGTMKGLAFLIADATSQARLGLCGVDEWFADDTVQIGYFLAAVARGRGYATRGVRLLTEWLVDLGAAKVFASTDATNFPSAAVLRRAGFVHERTVPHFGTRAGSPYDLAVYSR